MPLPIVSARRDSGGGANTFHQLWQLREWTGPLTRRTRRPTSTPKASLRPAEQIAQIDTHALDNYSARPHAALAAAFNYGALQQLRHGHIDRAERLCLRAIDLCQMLLERGYPLWWAEAMIEPRLNVGRLTAARGRVDEALTVFRDIFDFVVRNQSVRIQGVTYDPKLIIDSRTGAGSPASRHVYQSAGATCLFDSFRALAAVGRGAEGLQLVTEAWREWQEQLLPPIPFAEICELACLVHLLGGNYSNVLNAIAQLRDAARDDPAAGIACEVLTAEAAFRSGDIACGLSASRACSELLLASAAGASPTSLAYVVTRLAVARAAADAEADEGLSRQALTLSEHAGEGGLQLRCLSILSWVESCRRPPTRLWAQLLADAWPANVERLEKAAALCELARRADVAADRRRYWSAALSFIEPVATIDGRRLAASIKIAAGPGDLATDHSLKALSAGGLGWLDADFAALMSYRPIANCELVTQ